MFGTVTALILRIFSNPFSNVLQKHLTINGCKPLSVNFFTYLGLSIFCLLFFNNTEITEITAEAYKYAILGGVFGAAGNGFLVSALEKGDLSILGPINSYKSIVALLFGIIFLGEIPTFAGAAGIVLIIYGSYFIFSTQKEGFTFHLLKRRDIQYRILALIFTAIEAVFIKSVIVNSNILTAFVFWCWFGALFSFIPVIIRHQPIVPSCKDLKELFLLIFTTGIMQWSTNYVFSTMNVSYALALFQLSIILSVVFGWKIFNEKDLKIKLLGSFIMVIGSAIIILFN